ncbi:ClpP-like prohead protease/major capsid protein fusion protein [Arvimicrobium flavum]|uniref:ClpP-like prohead protease/major capsid protein fusion protein n=1 Tax=Arvimicrobium flavum TaxID=3393320 RepID=UPI00237B4E57|nr:ClpP-like prohead protease/major capsid protein fusion protein [Mesorhizobium shangrilense]
MAHRLLVGGELLLYGYVGGSIRWTEDGVEETGFTDEDVLDALQEVSGDIVCRINSAGGIAFQGIAIYNALKSHDGQVTIYIDALAGSAASVIAMAGDSVVMRPGSMMMVHNPAAVTIGNARDHRKTAEDLDELAAAAAEIYAAKTKRPTKDMLEIMAAETWMRGAVAKSLGFIDEIANEGEAEMSIPPFDYSLFKHAPDELRSSAANRAVAAPGIPAAPAAHTMEITMTTPAPAAPAIQPDPAAATLSVKDLTKDIFSRCRAAKLSIEDTEAVMDGAAGDVEKAKDLIIAKLAARDPDPTQIPSGGAVTITADARDRFKAGVTKSLLARAGLDGGEVNEFSGLSLREIARASLTAAGDKRSFADPMAMIGASLGMDFRATMAAGMHSTSDFPQILAAVASKSMLKGYAEAEETFPRWTSKGNLTDFKPTKRVDLNLFPNLEEVPEGGEYHYGTIGEHGETTQLATYGKMFAITRQAIINDDASVFTRIPTRMGRAAHRTIGNLVYAILTSNPNMADGVALFHANHGNLLGAVSALGVTSVDAARAAMARQKDPDGIASGLNIRMKYLLVPVELEGAARVLMSAEFDPSKTQRVPNPVAGIAEVISDARLSAGSTASWYAAGDPNVHDTIEVSYLNGNDKPTLEQRDGWNVDGVEFKVRIDAAVKALDFRALLKATGAAS